jgi:hypothetical protein
MRKLQQCLIAVDILEVQIFARFQFLACEGIRLTICLAMSIYNLEVEVGKKFTLSGCAII